MNNLYSLWCVARKQFRMNAIEAYSWAKCEMEWLDFVEWFESEEDEWK